MGKKIKDIVVMFNHIRHVAKDGVVYRKDIPTIWRNCDPAQVERFLTKKYGPKGLRVVGTETLSAHPCKPCEEKEKGGKVDGGDSGKSGR